MLELLELEPRVPHFAAARVLHDEYSALIGARITDDKVRRWRARQDAA